MGNNLPRILIVDDEPAIQRFLHTALDNDEFSLYQAENGHAALTAAVASKPDVILLDLGLPDMDGVEVIHRIRQWSQVPIIVLSVRDRENDKVKALDAGADYVGADDLIERLFLGILVKSMAAFQSQYLVVAFKGILYSSPDFVGYLLHGFPPFLR